MVGGVRFHINGSEVLFLNLNAFVREGEGKVLPSHLDADVAQLAEHHFRKVVVVSAILAIGSKIFCLDIFLRFQKLVQITLKNFIYL